MSSLATSKQIEKLPYLSGGQWKTSQSDQWTDVHNPFHGTVIGHVPICTTGEVGEVLSAANSAFAKWSTTSVAPASCFDYTT